MEVWYLLNLITCDDISLISRIEHNWSDDSPTGKLEMILP